MLKAISRWSIDSAKSVEQCCDEARAHSFAALELAIDTAGPLSVDTDEATCARYRKYARASGVIVETLASGMTWGCSPTHLDASIRARAIELHAAALQRAAWLGCKALLFVPGAVTIPWDPAYPAVPYDQAVDFARQAVAALLPVAEKTGVDLCVENVWNGLFYSPLELAAFIDSFNHPRLGIYFDAGNLVGLHQHPPHWIHLLGRRIRRVHIKDFKRSVGGLAGFCDLLQGDVPFPAVMAALRAVGYDATITAEMMPPDPTLLARTSAAMDKILSF